MLIGMLKCVLELLYTHVLVELRLKLLFGMHL